MAFSDPAANCRSERAASPAAKRLMWLAEQAKCPICLLAALTATVLNRKVYKPLILCVITGE